VINREDGAGMLVVAVVGSPTAGGRTRVAVDAMLHGAAAEGARTRVLELADTAAAEAVAAIDEADAAVLGSPSCTAVRWSSRRRRCGRRSGCVISGR
jgi:flavorubredoxin